MSGAATTVADVLGATAAEPTPTPSPTVSATKRGRGRPKGSTTRRRATAGAAATAASAATAGPAPRGPGRPTTTAARAERHRQGLANFYIGLGASAMVFGRLVGQQRLVDVGQAIKVQAHQAADALAKWGETSPAVAKALDALVLAGGGGLVISAHAPIVLAALGMGAPPDPDGAEPDLFGAVFSALTPDLGTMFGQSDGSDGPVPGSN